MRHKERKAEQSAFLDITYLAYEMKIIKKGQTYPVYSVYTKQSL